MFAGEIALTSTIVALLWLSIGLLLNQQRHDLIRGAKHDTANLARAFEENANHTIDAVDQTLVFLRSIYRADPVHFSFASWNESVHASDGPLLQVAIIGKDGRLLASNLGQVDRRLDLSDREHFRVQRDSDGDRLFVSKPVRGRESGRWSIQLTRKILAADGSFCGVIVASLDPFSLSRFFSSVEIGRGFVFLAGLDGIIRAGHPACRNMLGRDVGAMPILSAARTSGHGTLAFRDRVGTPEIASFRSLDRYGLVVAVAFSRHDMLAAYRRTRSQYLAGGGVLSMLMLLVAFLLVRHKQRLRLMRINLVQSREVLTETLENMTQGIMMVDAERRIPVINRRAVELLGLPSELAASGLNFDEILSWRAGQGESRGNDGTAEIGKLADPEALGADALVYEHTRPNGTVLEVRTRNLGDRRTVLTLTDVTERHRAEARVSYLAHHDVMTGLTNRAMFHRCLTHAIGLTERTGAGFAVLFLDLDHFKLVNDTWGHAVGDGLLAMVADRIRETVRAIDTVARFGGDEFAILQAVGEQPDAAATLAQRLIGRLSEPYEIEGRQITVGVSVGVAIYPQDGCDAEQVLKSADIALYAAKEDGRGQCRFFEAEMDRRLQERLALERDLREAIASNRLEVAYQPICEAGSQRPIAYEALARWTHPTRGVIPPVTFIPLAEEAGLIGALGLAVLRTACRAATRWPDDVQLTVNFSPVQFFDLGFEQAVLDVLGETGLHPSRLGLEITEGVLIRNDEAVAAALRRLQRGGIRILLDDFGTGHAGLSYLMRFRFDCIKLDRSFVARMAEDDAARAVIRATLVLSASLHLDVVAEGVETEEQLHLLHGLGCRRMQGYLFGAPRPACDGPDRLARADRDAAGVLEAPGLPSP